MSEIYWNRMTAEDLKAYAARDAIVLLPVGSTEQHGPHLPTGVDDLLCSEICKRVANIVQMQRAIVVAPAVWFGLADHHVDFGGTFTIRLETYHAILRDLCRSIQNAGFRHIVLVNGHGGNIAGLAALTLELTRELGIPIATTTYFVEGDTTGILEDQAGVMHACEAETSMMMAAAPDLVRRERLAEAHGPAIDIISSLLPSLKRVQPFRSVTESGVAGDARKASIEKGEAFLEACSRAIAGKLIEGKPWDEREVA